MVSDTGTLESLSRLASEWAMVRDRSGGTRRWHSREPVEFGDDRGSGTMWRFDTLEFLGQGHGLFAKGRARAEMSGTPVALLKVSQTDWADRSIAHEQAVLGSLSEQAPGLAPVPLRLGTSGGRTWSAQTYLQESGTARASLSRGRAIAARVRELTLPAPDFRVPAALGVKDDACGLEASHGDFARWNLLCTDAGIAVLDWEWATPAGSPGFDICHLLVGGALMTRDLSDLTLRIRMGIARNALRKMDLEPRTALLAYARGMREFYAWCESIAESESEPSPVEENARRLEGRLA